MARVLGTPGRSPVAVRFSCPISMAGVDDMGFVDDTFWAGLGGREVSKLGKSWRILSPTS
jgi:hypothetical protein